MSVHSNMLGVTHQDGSFVNGGSSFRRDGSLMSGSMRGSNFQRGTLLIALFLEKWNSMVDLY